MLLSAFACMNTDPASRPNYDKQRTRGKTHTQALLRLARQRISVPFTMLRDGTFYEPRVPKDVEPAATPQLVKPPKNRNPGASTKDREAPPLPEPTKDTTTTAARPDDQAADHGQRPQPTPTHPTTPQKSVAVPPSPLARCAT